MIERYSITADVGDMVEAFQIKKLLHCYTNRFNIAPTQTVSIVMNDKWEQRTMHDARWGLFPFWAKDSINADTATLSDKRFFDRMLRRQRCVVPCSGFFGWQQFGREKEPRAMHIVVPQQRLLGVAGFYDEWRNYSGELVRAFTMLTASSSGAMSQWQPRVPIVLDEEGLEDWLNPRVQDYRSLRKHLEPLESYQMRAYPVTNAIGDEAYESPDCIREIRPDFA
ncbi:SOS response-associated peptidase [Paenibacillus gorillae]|uniref:SOS response-associated peptidase n=1 Tax=Paenibacillus gorillae TaxID=1243662 RepID=UPI0004B2205D|nr:SOS response-associated peptidase [Paenibacillus gorillae]